MDRHFIDRVALLLQSGHGGAGSVHFYRGRYIPKGGPDGGDGGDGGNIIVEVSPQCRTLLHLKYTKKIIAPNGEVGGHNKRHGARGKDCILRIPPGTILTNATTGKKLKEWMQPGLKEVLLKGGKGGRGNTHFKSATKQAPTYAQKGMPGQAIDAILELKLLADIGLIGPPNAGKSTLLSTLSAAKPTIANYPFTTLTPQLGVVHYKREHSYIVAEIPGLIPQASQGKGLGIRFLKHAERNFALLILIPSDHPDPRGCYEMLQEELRAYNPAFMDKKQLIVLSKSDLLSSKETEIILQKLPDTHPKLAISAATNDHIECLKEKLWLLSSKHSLVP